MINKLLKINMLGEKNEEFFNKIIKYYIIFTSIIYILFTIAPIMALIRDTFLYRMQTYLGIFGGLIILLDFFSYRKLFSIKNSYYLYFIFAISIVSSFIYMNYGGIKDNLFTITWFLIFISIFYCGLYNIYDKSFEIIFDKLLLYLGVIYSFFAFLSILTFYFNIGFYLDIDPAIGNSLARQGFLQNRLFGLFTSINNSALISSILFLANLYRIFTLKSYKKLMIIVMEIILYTFIVLSGSRSAEVSIISSLSIIVLIYLRNKKYNNISKLIKHVLNIIITLFVVILILFSIKITKITSETIANYVNKNLDVHEILEKKFLINNSKLDYNDLDIDNTEVSTRRKDTNRRKDTKNISNNRFKIWGDYINSYKNIGILGLSPKNYSEYLQDKRQDLYIVEHIKNNYPKLYEAGEIYHPHNGYLIVYVATGILGGVLLILFLLNILVKFIKIYKNPNILSDKIMLISIVIVISILVNILFDQGVFFINDFVSVIFWISLSMFVKKFDLLLKGEQYE